MPDEKFDEKVDEKSMEKHDEKSPEEKSWDEKYRRDPLGSIVWAVILIWAGVVFLLTNLGFLDRFIARSSDLPGWGFMSKLVGAWPIVLIGAGVIILIEVVIRLVMPVYRRPVTGSIILAIIFIGIGLGDLVSWDLIWPTIIIVLGLSLIFRGVRKGSSPSE